MMEHSWHTLVSNKYKLSLRLYLLLTIFSALITLLNPIFIKQPVTTPLLLVLCLSLGLLGWHWVDKKRVLNIYIIAFIFGCLWAWHISVKYSFVTSDHFNWLLISFLNVLFVGSLAFSSDIKAFALHSSPILLVSLAITGQQHWIRILFTNAIPVAGIAIHQVILRSNERFTKHILAQLIKEREALNTLSMKDPLTGLYNRRGLQNRLDNPSPCQTGQRYVLLLDMDHFKAYNDHYGHLMGDVALTRVSATIRDAVRPQDIACRFGGEEFLVLLSDIDLNDALQVAERIRQQIFDLNIPHLYNGNVAPRITISIGIARLDSGKLELAIAKADEALYAAKNQGRNTTQLSPELHAA